MSNRKSAPPRHRLPRRILLIRALIGVTCVILLSVIYVAASIWIEGKETAQSAAQAAIVLGASIRGDEPTPVFKERINHSIALYREGRVRKLIFTGGFGRGNNVSDSEVAKRYAVGQGVAASDILTESESRTTFENLRYAQQLARQHGLDSFLIISDPLHMKRSMAMAKDLGLQAQPSPTPSSAYKSFPSQSAFLGRETYFYIIYRLHLGANQ